MGQQHVYLTTIALIVTSKLWCLCINIQAPNITKIAIVHWKQVAYPRFTSRTYCMSIWGLHQQRLLLILQCLLSRYSHYGQQNPDD